MPALCYVSVLISFSGLPGVGKTTVARALAQEIDAAYIHNGLNRGCSEKQ